MSPRGEELGKLLGGSAGKGPQGPQSGLREGRALWKHQRRGPEARNYDPEFWGRMLGSEGLSDQLWPAW